eukprot:260955_1
MNMRPYNSLRRIATVTNMKLNHSALYRGMYKSKLTYQPIRKFSKPVAPAYKFNQIQRNTHGPKAYFQEWEALIFSHAEWRQATIVLQICFVMGSIFPFYCFWNSLWRDPEVRLRPHKKAWQFDEKTLARKADKYRMGGTMVIPTVFNKRKRIKYLRKVCEEGFDEPGQNGWEEIPIPKLDD